jgi:hypothetical protein
MWIPDVINTLLMGLIFMVIVVTVVRPFVLHMVGADMTFEDMQKAAIEAVESEMMRNAALLEAQRSEKIRFQQLLLDVPEKPKPKPVVVPEPEPEPEPEPVAEEPVVEEVPVEEPEVADESLNTDETTEEVVAEATPEEGSGDGEIEIREGESLADIKERIKREKKQAAKPTIPPELLNGAKSYEDKVGVVRMVVQSDQSRVASVIRSMIQTK